MPINQEFYDLNSGRGYPLADSATGLSDAGDRLPNGLLVDGCLRFPVALGELAFLSAVHVTERLISFIVSVAASPSAASFLPIAACSIPGPGVEGQVCELTALVPGTGGWLILGDVRDAEFSGRFSTAAQSLLLPRIARGYDTPPVSSLAVAGATNLLQGVVNLAPLGNLTITQGSRLIAGRLRPAIILALSGTLTTVLPAYTGPNGGRPESNTCNSPPVQRLGNAVPDSSGNITLQLEGLAATLVPSGILIGTPLSIASICGGALPIPYSGTGECNSLSVISEIIGFDDIQTTDSHPVGGDTGFTPPVYGLEMFEPTYPHYGRFFSNLTPADFLALRGIWAQFTAVPPQFPGSDFGQAPGTFRSLGVTDLHSSGPSGAIDLLLDPGYDSLVEYVLEGAVQLNGSPRAGLVLDWIDYYGPGTCLVLRLNTETSALELCSFNGVVYSVPLASLPVPDLSATDWYRITLTVSNSPDAQGYSHFRGEVLNMSTSTLPLPPSSNWFQLLNQPSPTADGGRYGFYSESVGALFGYLLLDLPQ